MKTLHRLFNIPALLALLFEAFQHEVAENRWLAPMFLSRFDRYTSTWAWVDYTIASMFDIIWSRLLCWLLGHQLECDSSCGPDSGSETIYCTRCGLTQHITYY